MYKISEIVAYQLKDIADVQTGPFGSQLHMSDYVKEGTPIITVEHFGENKLIHKNLPLVSLEDKKRLIKYTLKEGDIVFSRVGSVDRRAYITDSEDGWMFSGRCLRVRPHKHKVNGKYLSYYFGQKSFKEYIKSVAVGATMPSINTDILSTSEIILPPIKEQEAIAEVLSSLDDKIDLLHRNNKTLEQLAEILFKQWFVIDISSDNNKGKLGQVINLNYGKALKDEIRDGYKYPVIGSSGVVGFHSDFLVKGPGIVIGRKGTLGKVNLVYDNFFPIDTTYYVTSNIENSMLFYEYFLLKEMSLGEHNCDSAVPGLNRDIALSLEINLPDLDKVNMFNNAVQPFFDKVHLNNMQINQLRKIRDSILPKLMSGQIIITV